ncbi:porin [Acinetobacter rudis]|uniref:porin n=1 Tax=Acinetobacter rudis TaxID=632955 RepID=UPI00280EEEB3|nr:porin [Acinetobacter rudis]MDQ8952265.1 porin [Acinetobacter rudis]
MKRKSLYLNIMILSISNGMLNTAHAEMDIIKKGQLTGDLLSPIRFQFGGQLRPEWIFKSGDQQKYQRNLHDGASRLRFTLDYELSPETLLTGYYELGINIPKILGWEDHYVPNAPSHDRRQAYIAIEDLTLGRLSYGKQYGMQYSVIGIKSDVWDNDGLASPSSLGINGEYDGASTRVRNSLMYTKKFDRLKLYANILFPESSIPSADDSIRYKRQSGAGLGLDFSIKPDTTLSAAFSNTKAKIYNLTEEKQLNQQILGTAITFNPNQWYLVGTASYYHNFVPTHQEPQPQNYFYGDGYGLEAFAGYNFKFDRNYFYELQPYIAADRLVLNSTAQDNVNHQFIGLITQVNKDIKVYTEYTFVNAKDKSLKDMAYITIYYSF